MTKLYKKNEPIFAIIWIVIYVVLTSLADKISASIGIIKSATASLHIIMSLVLFFWIKKNDLCSKYGLCKAQVSGKKFLYYFPLVIIASSALWYGAEAAYGFPGTLLYIVSMCCVGFLEEVIFRGLLFRAMLKDNTRDAIIISALTFGLGHIVNLFNGSGQNLISTLIQIIFAVMVGFVLVLIFYYGGSLIPCILFHSINNALRAFSVEANINPLLETAIDIILLVVILGGYLIYLVKAFQKKKEKMPSKENN